MQSRIQTVVLPDEAAHFSEEIRSVFLELGHTFPTDAPPGECSPPIDVFETDDALDVSVDLPGVDSTAVRVIAKGDSLLIVGEKAPRQSHAESTFHLVERGFGRFARVIHLGRACDSTKAHATLADGELRISVPKIADRRGRSIQISVQSTQEERPG